MSGRLLVSFVVLVSSMAFAQKPACRDLPVELMEMSVQELMGLEISSISKKAQKLSDAAGAIFVITQEDIKRSGAASIPELLRMVPGLEVARINSSSWAISARGFNDRFSNKLLVLMDGRSVYTPVFSGVFWDSQDTMLEDIERIEVIRGPGAALWGANAVNGVIDIITKSAGETQGGLVTSGFGTEERGFGAVRYGSKANDNAFYRVYAKYFDRDGGFDTQGGSAPDEWHAFRAGFRTDWQSSTDDTMTFLGDVLKGRSGERVSDFSLAPPFVNQLEGDANFFEANVLARWKHVLSPTSDLQAQFYYDFNPRKDLAGGIEAHTIDADFQHRFALTDRQEVIWGAGLRYHQYGFDTGTAILSQPDIQDDKLFSAFFHDDITLVTDRLHFILGSKFEHNDFTGFEVQPNARILWTPDEAKTLWTSVSRAVRTPSVAELAIESNAGVIPPGIAQNPSPLPVELVVRGNEHFLSEELTAFELGYRFQALPVLWLDLAGYYNIYENLRTVEQGDPQLEMFPAPHTVVPLTAGNNMHGNTYGVEAAAEWDPMKRLRFRAAYTYLIMDLQSESGSRDTSSRKQTGSNPHHQLSLRCLMDLPHDVTLDLWMRYVDSLPELKIDSYVTADVRLAWKPLKSLEIAVVGRNLFEAHHSEFGQDIFTSTVPTSVERGVYGKVTWSF